jgi:hypothetical protein
VREPGPLPPSIGEDPGSRTEPSGCPGNRCRTRRVRHRPGRRVRERRSVGAACNFLSSFPAEPAPHKTSICVPGRAGPDGDHRHTEDSVREPGPSPSSTGQDPGSRSEPSVCPGSRRQTRRVRHRPGRRVRERKSVSVACHVLSAFPAVPPPTRTSICVPGRAGPGGDHRHTEGSVREPGPSPPSTGQDPGSRAEPSAYPRSRCQTRRVRPFGCRNKFPSPPLVSAEGRWAADTGRASVPGNHQETVCRLAEQSQTARLTSSPSHTRDWARCRLRTIVPRGTAG